MSTGRDMAALGRTLALLVERDWYRATYPDVAAAGLDPVKHFTDSGWQEGRQPNPYFATAWYLAKNPEAAAMPGGPLIHYLLVGEARGAAPAPEFDPAWYRKTHDLAAGVCCLAHFLLLRRGGQVSPNPGFDARFYVAEYPDVAAAGLDPFAHYRATGREEGRLPRPEAEILRACGLFDANYYLLQNEDVLERGIDPALHYLGTGWREGRWPNPYFAPLWYAHRLPAAYPRNPLTHYVLRGEAEGRPPSPLFDPAWYRSTYALAEGSSALLHYLAHRRSQRFSPLPLFDLAFYLGRYGRRIGPNRDPFGHYLTVGTVEDLDPAPGFDARAYRARHMPPRSAARRRFVPERDNPLIHFLITAGPAAAAHGPAPA
jgi:hypothetical protein